MSECCIPTEYPGSCELVPDERSSQASPCAGCRSEGRSVQRQTVLHHVRSELLQRVGNGEYRFCTEPECPIVYFGDDATSFAVDDLRELVTAKTRGDKRPICYCFGFIEGDARREIERTGQSTIPATVSRLIKAGMCACEVRNPAGVCCLGEVNRTVNRLSAQRKASVQIIGAQGWREDLTSS